MWINTVYMPFMFLFISFSILFFLGSFLITVQRGWILLTLLPIGIFQRWYHWNTASICLDLLTLMLMSVLCTTQPVGALSADRLKKFQERYSSFEDPVIPKFHYGSHYSSAGTVGSFPFVFQFSYFVMYCANYVFCAHNCWDTY